MDTYEQTPFDGVYDESHELDFNLVDSIIEINPMQPSNSVRGFKGEDMHVNRSASMDRVVYAIKDAISHPNCTLSKFSLTMPSVIESNITKIDESDNEVLSGTFKIAYVVADEGIGESITIELDVDVEDGVMVKLPKKVFVEELNKSIKLKPDTIRKAIAQTKLTYQ
jgi:hypothetical protein